MSLPEPIFCCSSTSPVAPSNNHRLHNDPNRGIHNLIFQSFLAFAARRERAAALMALISSEDPSPSAPPSPVTTPPPEPVIPAPVLTAEALKNNPITSNTPYVIHLTSRHDFGPVFSHRYFVCPQSLEQDWVEATLEQWFAVGEQFKLKAEKWDLKCTADAKFYRATLRPNLCMRYYPQAVGIAQGGRW